MGTKAREIIDMPVNTVIELLNAAYSDEWLAHYQYWLGAKLVRGPMKDAVEQELIQHAADELRHADMIAERIIQLGGTPVLEPKEWDTISNCQYFPPTDEHVSAIVKQNIEGEHCAIEVYQNILKKTEGKDPVTYDMVTQILKDEVEHEQDLEDLNEDIELLVNSSSR